MRAREFLPGQESKARFVEMFSKFLPLAMRYLKLKRLPKMVFQSSIHDEQQPTFGSYVNDENTLYVGISNRHPVDILRTVAHELQHYKQDTDHKLHANSGMTGSPEENEAHAMAGIVMRHFNKLYPEYLGDKPVVSESWSQKYKRSINCNNPKGFSQRAHCQGRKKKNESTGDKPTDPGPKEFVSNKFYVKFTDEAMLIFDSGELVYKKPGDFSVPTRQHASTAKGITTSLWQEKHGQRPRFITPFTVLKPTDIHKVADEKRIPWDNDRKFLNLSKKLTGKSHLDKMSPEELRVMFDYLSKIKIKEDVAQGLRNLVIFDIDDTLMHTTAQIKVVNDQGKVLKSLTNQEFNNYKLQPGEQFDFGEFRDAEKFNRESEPIWPIMNKLKDVLDNSPNAEPIMLTARSDFDNKEKFLDTFRQYGIDMSRVHVHRAGNLPGDEIPAEKKAVYVRKYLNTGKYKGVWLYDDSRSNLSVFKDLKNEYPDVNFHAIYVGPKGVTNPVENFHDGRNPQDKGDSKRYGVPTKASVSTLRKVAKQGGRKGQLAHWMANMKAGRAKKHH